MPTMYVRLQDDVVSYFSEHPEVRPSKLIDLLARQDLGLDTPQPTPRNRYEIRVSADVAEAIEGQGKQVLQYIRALLLRHVDAERIDSDD